MSEAMKLILIAASFFAIPVVGNTNVGVVVARPYESVHFECEARGDFSVWLINSITLTNATKKEREIVVTDTSSNDTQHTVLIITALPINDRITISCIVGLVPHTVTFFNEETLEIRGVSSVENLMLNFTSSNSLFISWSPPIYYSDDVLSEDLIYEVFVAFELEILIQYVKNTLIEVSNVTGCDTFNVSVTVLDLKNYRSTTRTEGNEGSYSIALDKNCSTNQVAFQFDFLPSHCPSLVSIDIEPSNGNKSVYITSTNWNMEHFNYTLPPFEHYKLVLHVENLREQVKNELVANISTYRVQDTDLILYNNGSVVVSCQYCVPVAESVREGCYVIINNSDEGLKKTINITGSDEETITLESGSYTVTTYDLVNGSIKGPATAPIQLEVTIDNIDPSTSTDSSLAVNPTNKQHPSVGIIVGITLGSVLFNIGLLSALLIIIIIIIKFYQNSSTKQAHTFVH